MGLLSKIVGLFDSSFASKQLEGIVLDGKPLNVGLVRARTRETGSDYKRIQDKLLGKLETNEYDLLVAPEYSFVPYVGAFTEPEKDEIVGAMKEKTRGKKTLLLPGTFLWQRETELYNTAYALYDGAQICEYHKINEADSDSNAAEKQGLWFHCGTKPCVFHWKGLKIGMEICADANVLYNSEVIDCDIHVLVSCGRTNTEPCGKYTIIDDGLLEFCRILKGERPILTRVF